MVGLLHGEPPENSHFPERTSESELLIEAADSCQLSPQITSDMASRVENRRSHFSLPVDIDGAFASSPQSGLAWFCFLFPLIEPDWQRTGLADFPHPALGKDTRCYV